GAVGSYSAFDATMEDWRRELIAWRCRLSEAERRRLGAPAAWNCRDVQFFIGKISFGDLGPQRAAGLNAVETRLKLPPEQVDLLVNAGRDALFANPKFRAFMNSLPRLPQPPQQQAPRAAPVAEEPNGVAARQALAQ